MPGEFIIEYTDGSKVVLDLDAVIAASAKLEAQRKQSAQAAFDWSKTRAGATPTSPPEAPASACDQPRLF